MSLPPEDEDQQPTRAACSFLRVIRAAEGINNRHRTAGRGWHGMIQSDPMDFKLVCSRFQVRRKRNDVP